MDIWPIWVTGRLFWRSEGHAVPRAGGRVEILKRAELGHCPKWTEAFRGSRKDRRYYEVVEDTINPEFNYGYFGLREEAGSMSCSPFSSSIRIFCSA